MMGEIYEIEGQLNEDCGITPRIFEYLFKRIRMVSCHSIDIFHRYFFEFIHSSLLVWFCYLYYICAGRGEQERRTAEIQLQMFLSRDLQ